MQAGRESAVKALSHRTRAGTSRGARPSTRVVTKAVTAILVHSTNFERHACRRKSCRHKEKRAMAQCEYCEKKPAMGNQIEHRGKAKYLGGVGTKVTGI